MRRSSTIGIVVVCATSLAIAGCNKTTKTDTTGKTNEEHDHDKLVWDTEGIEESGYRIDLGKHGDHVDAGFGFEPAVVITKDGTDVDDAEVFVALLSDDKKTVLAEEVQAEFEPRTDDEPAHYAKAELKVPNTPPKMVIRYRIKLPGGIEKEFYSKSITAQ